MVLLPFVSYSQKKLPGFINPVSYHWADSVLDEMTVDEKIGQLNLPSAGDFTTGQAQNSDIGKKIENEI